jgi:hypothetical protein
MVKKFEDCAGREHCAVQAWQILVSLAHNRQTATYEQMSQIMEYGTGHNVKYALDPIFWFCEENELPPLTALVVLKRDGVPGNAFVEAYPDFPRVQAKVFNYPWYELYPPTAEQYAELIGH